MAVKRVCHRHGLTYPAGERCPRCPAGNTSWSGNRDREAQRRFRATVLERDGHRCTACGATERLRACHVVPLAAAGSYETVNGITRCETCDRATDPHAR